MRYEISDAAPTTLDDCPGGMTPAELDTEIAALQRYCDRYPGEPTTPTEYPDYFAALATLAQYKQARAAMQGAA